VSEPKPKNPLGPTGEAAAERVRELREAKGWTYKELSDRLTKHGRPIPSLGLRRIENQDRRIDADDLTALAVVLGVSPVSLLLPLRTHGEVKITGAGPVEASRAWAWAQGHRPLRDPQDDDPDGVAYADFIENARPSLLVELLETREGRRRLAARVSGLPDWTVEREGDEIIRIIRPSAQGPTVLWPLEGDDDGR
jgi:transcriptional regulator with XRE-family HTH domain